MFALSALGLSPHATAAEAKRNAKMCGVAEKGFTYFPSADDGAGILSYGLVVRNKTRKKAVQVESFANFLNAEGKLVHTERNTINLGYLAQRDRVNVGDTFSVQEPIVSMKITVVCARQSKLGAQQQDPPLTKRVSFTGEVTALEDEGFFSDATVTGTFSTKRRSSARNGTGSFLLRDNSGSIVGGESLSTGEFGSVPQGLTIAWTTTVSAPFPVGTKAEGSVGMYGAIWH